MESKILIDVCYSTRQPQILIQSKQSDDPRDKLVSMFTGEAMPGVRDGYCRIERTHSNHDIDHIQITPLDPIEAVKHIKAIVRLALENNAIDTTGVRELISKILKDIEPELTVA